MNTNTEVFGNNGLTPGAALSCTSWVNLDIHPTSIFRFVLDALSELIPSYITNASIHTTPVTIHHVLDLQLLDSNDAKLVNQLPCFLVGKVMPPVSYPFVDTGYDLLRLSSLRRSLLQLRQLSLSLGQSLLICLKETRVWNFLTCRKSGEGSQPNIDSNRRIGWRQCFRFILRGEAGVPFVILPSDSAGADFSEGLAVQPYFKITHFCQLKTAVYVEPELGVGETAIPVVSLESGISGSLPSLHSPEKSTKRFVQSVCHILKNLGVDIIEAGAFCFKLCDTLALLEIGKRFLLFLPSVPALLQELVIKPSALIKLRLQKISLVLGWVEPVFKRFIHCINYTLKRGWCQANSSPALKCGAFLA